MTYGVRLCRFTSLDDIPKRDRSKPDVLLKFFQESGVRQVSTFEMTQPIYNALKALEKDGQLKLLDTPYPWIGFQLGKTGNNT
jgi:hypothetical protein